LTSKPTLFSGVYTDLTSKPTNFQADWNTTIINKPTLFSGSYTDLTSKPTLFSGVYTDLTSKPDLSVYITTTNANALNSRFFNNNGNNYGNRSDFNSPTQFGYNYITGSTNGPGVNGATEYYSWDIGLGAQYPFGTYRAQFALPRNVGNPYLCVRYQENGGYGGWNKISAGYADSANYANSAGSAGSATTADSLTSGDKSISGTLTATALRTLDFYMSAGTCDCLILKARDYILLPSSWKIIIGTHGGTANSMGFKHESYNSVWFLQGNQPDVTDDLSDVRVKREIKPIENALSIIEKIEPKQYIKLVDRDKRYECGLIAQDAEKIDEIKNYVYNEPYYIPNIYEDCPYDNDNKIFTTIGDYSSLLVVGTKIKIVLDKKDGENNINNTKSKWCCVYTEIIEVLGENKYKLKDDIDINEADIFIYGTFQDDFRTIDYKSLYAINLQATKDLYSIIKDLQERIKILETK
jgi:hypothetical protein